MYAYKVPWSVSCKGGSSRIMCLEKLFTLFLSLSSHFFNSVWLDLRFPEKKSTQLSWISKLKFKCRVRKKCFSLLLHVHSGGIVVVVVLLVLLLVVLLSQLRFSLFKGNQVTSREREKKKESQYSSKSKKYERRDADEEKRQDEAKEEER